MGREGESERERARERERERGREGGRARAREREGGVIDQARNWLDPGVLGGGQIMQ